MNNTDKKVRYAQIQLLHKQTKVGLVGVMVVSLGACFIFWNVVAQWRLLLWVGVIFVLSLIRGGIVFTFQKRVQLTSDIDRWARLHEIGILASSLTWMVPFVFLWPGENIIYQFVWPILVLPLSAAGVAGYYTWPKSYIPFLLLTTLPVSTRFFYEGGLLLNMIGFLSLFFIGVMMSAGRVMHAASLRAFKLNIHNQELNEVLKNEISTSEHLNVKLQQEVLERKMAEKQIRDKNTELHKINTSKDLLFSIIAHDLRGPFSNILGLTDIMRDKESELSNDELRELADATNRSSTKAFDLLDTLLEWGRIQQGKVSFNPQMTCLKELTTNITDALKDTYTQKNIRLVNLIPNSTNVYIDNHLVQTILRNLIHNAIKFTPSGGNITLSTKGNDMGQINVCIEDSGIGMSQELIEDLFNLDFNTNRAGTNGEPSIGLGLIICKELIEKQGGQLNIESIPNKGSLFSFSVPISNS
ncbi:sensor histidine kinase [Carboxylicivirga marina]|uniref:histidine kinase n=1 Tax=Carboxylicivirga marina TaxID=2800988 RepID=A0ABS1HRU1_9BACT|nr:HAMP domain-containing sensor histidine kinase [Carboxylicivirga marina]MBK3519973.1 HAMP domain-containing histidine kinase [Carboxylicivirga marina]